MWKACHPTMTLVKPTSPSYLAVCMDYAYVMMVRCCSGSGGVRASPANGCSVEPSATSGTSEELSLRCSPSGQTSDASGILHSLSIAEQKQLKVLQYEFDSFVATGMKLPSAMSDEMWLRLLKECAGKSARIRLYGYFYDRESRILAEDERKARRREKVAVRQQEILVERQQKLIAGTQYYAEPHSSIFLKIYARIMRLQDDFRVAHSMVYGQPIVIDMGFGSSMNRKEHASLHRELLEVYSSNREMQEPFHIHLCNVDYNDPSVKLFGNVIVNLPPALRTSALSSDGVLAMDKPVGNIDHDEDRELPDVHLMTFTESCYRDQFQRDKIVYLTPNAKDYMEKYDHDATYIIGGLVDLGPQGPLTIAKAKQQNIRTMKLPLDLYVKWKQGKKGLGIHHVFGILKDLKESNGDWKYALGANVPSRFMRSQRDHCGGTAMQRRSWSHEGSGQRSYEESGPRTAKNREQNLFVGEGLRCPTGGGGGVYGRYETNHSTRYEQFKKSYKS